MSEAPGQPVCCLPRRSPINPASLNQATAGRHRHGMSCSVCKMPTKIAKSKGTGSAKPASAGAAGAANAASPKPRTTPKKPKDSCFVICPFGGWHDEYHEQIFCAAIKAAGLEPRRADDLFRSSNIVHDVWHLVSSSKVMLADLTGKNPNVFYELGLAHAARKPVLLVTQTMDDVPFDLRALRVITYDVQDPTWGDQLRENIKSGLRETLESPAGSVLPTFLLETPKDQTTVSPDERRYLALRQQVDALRSELRGGESSAGSSERTSSISISALAAETEIDRLIARGTPRPKIIERLRAMGVPRSWIKDRLDERGYRPARIVTS